MTNPDGGMISWYFLPKDNRVTRRLHGGRWGGGINVQICNLMHLVEIKRFRYTTESEMRMDRRCPQTSSAINKFGHFVEIWKPSALSLAESAGFPNDDITANGNAARLEPNEAAFKNALK